MSNQFNGNNHLGGFGFTNPTSQGSAGNFTNPSSTATPGMSNPGVSTSHFNGQYTDYMTGMNSFGQTGFTNPWAQTSPCQNGLGMNFLASPVNTWMGGVNAWNPYCLNQTGNVATAYANPYQTQWGLGAYGNLSQTQWGLGNYANPYQTQWGQGTIGFNQPTYWNGFYSNPMLWANMSNNPTQGFYGMTQPVFNPNNTYMSNGLGFNRVWGQTIPNFTWQTPYNTLGVNPVACLNPFIGATHALNPLTSQISNGFNMGQSVPAISVAENQKELRISAELPGATEDDIQIVVQNGMVIIRGEKRLGDREHHSDFISSERYVGIIYRAIPLPRDVDANRIRSELIDGVLNIFVPKTKDAQSNFHNVGISSTATSASTTV